MKFTLQRDSHEEKTRYQQRIEELEAELDAAQQVIAGQQQVLEANLEASCREDREIVTLNLPPEAPLPPLRTTQGVSASERPPIPLPDFGPPLTDIARRVVRASNTGGSSEQTGAATPVTTLPPAPSDRPAVPDVSPAASHSGAGAGLFRSLQISAAALGSVILLTAFWAGVSLFSSSRAGRTKTPITGTHTARSQPAVLASRPTPEIDNAGIAKTPDSVMTKTPYKDFPVSPKKSRALQTAKMSRVIPASNARPSHRTREIASTHSRKSGRAEHASPREQDSDNSFAREERQHPPPGWDEAADRWLDRLP